MIGVTGKAKYDTARIKEIQGVSTDDETTESRLIALAAWMKEYIWIYHDPGIEDSTSCKRQSRARRKNVLFSYRVTGMWQKSFWQNFLAAV